MSSGENSRQRARTWPFTRYKSYEKSLRRAAEKWFTDRGFELHPKMNYCLARHELWPKNIICEDVVDYIQSEQKRHLGENSFPLHKYLHHGLSSQAMAFNLIGPLIVRNDLEPLRIAAERNKISWPTGNITAGFEHEDREVFNEDVGQPTSIDITIIGESAPLFIEAEVSEREFGGCSVFSDGDCEGKNPYPNNLDSCYLQHIGRKYWDLVKEHGFGMAPIMNGQICPFVNYYQFFREVLFYFAKNGTFILLNDERNPAFLKTSMDGSQQGLWPFLSQAVLPKKVI